MKMWEPRGRQKKRRGRNNEVEASLGHADRRLRQKLLDEAAAEARGDDKRAAMLRTEIDRTQWKTYPPPTEPKQGDS